MSALSCGFKFKLLVSMKSQFQSDSVVSNRVSILEPQNPSRWSLRENSSPLSLIIFAENSILDVWLGSGCTSELHHQNWVSI